MLNFFSCFRSATKAAWPVNASPLLVGLALLPLLAPAQTPTVTRASLNPAANARTAPVGTTVQVPFSQPISATTAGNIKLFSAQYRGLRTASVSGGGTSTITLTPTVPATGSQAAAFKPGETVQVSVPASVQSTSGTAAAKYVYQFTAAATGGGANFVAPATNADPTVGAGPYNMAVGDVDGDGDLDALVANYGSGSVSVLLNDGTGNYTVQATSAGTTGLDTPRGVVMGDVDGDGDLDFVVSNGSSSNPLAYIRLNDGAGNFTAPVSNPSTTLSSSPFDVVLGDLDGDGDLDLIASNFGNARLSVRFNNGVGGFTGSAGDVSVGPNPRGLALGDLDGDGDLDVVTASNTSPAVSVRLNNGSGSFTAAANPPSVQNATYDVAVGDIDGDNDLDIVASQNANGAVIVLTNDGTANFTYTGFPSVGSNPFNVALGDVDGDGDLDLLAANAGTNGNPGNTVSVRLNNGAGSFSAPAVNPNPTVGSQPSDVALGDIDGDGDLDLLAANFGNTTTLGSTVSVRRNVSTPVITSFTPTTGLIGSTITLNGVELTGTTAITFTGTSGNVVTTGYTVNNNGTQITGIVVPSGAQTGTLTVTTALGTSPASSQTFTLIPPLLVTALNPARNALAAATTTTVGITFSTNVNSTTAGNIKIFSPQYRGQRTATASTSNNTVTLTPTVPATGSQVAAFRPGETLSVTVPATVQSTGGVAATPHVYQFTTAVGGTGRGNFVAPATTPNPLVGAGPMSVAAADLDSDGDPDMLVANNNGGTVSVRFNDGSGVYSGSTNVTVGANPTGVVAADVDGDGDLDLLAANGGGNSVSVRFNNGSGAFSGTTDVTVGGGPSGVVAADVDGDGDLDILASNNTAGTVSVRLNNGSGVYTGTTDVVVGNGTSSVAAADVDGDGDLDILATNGTDNNVSVRLNNGSGVFSGTVNVTTGANPTGVTAADVDGDGDLDMLVAAYSGTVNVHFNTNGTFGSPTAITLGGSSPHNITAVDVDRDGDLDLLVASFNTVIRLLNNGSGTFGNSSNVAVGDNPQSVAAADVDGDGDLDILVPNFNDNTVSVRLNVGLPTITSFTPTLGTTGTTISLVGTNLNGTTAITFTGTSGNVTTTGYTVNAAGTQITGIVVPSGAQTGTLTVTTPSGTSAASTQTFTVVPVITSLSPASGSVGSSVTISGSGFNSTAAQNIVFFGATRATVTAASANSLTVTVPANSTYQYPSVTNLGPGLTAYAPAPFTVTLNGVIAFKPKVDITTGTGSFSVSIGDVDGDGKADLVVPNINNGTVSVFRNTSTSGAVSFAAGVSIATGSQAQYAAVVDVDGDGKLDLAVANHNATTVSVLRNTSTSGTISFAPKVDYTTGNSPYFVISGDVDGDGKPDLVLPNETDNTVSVLRNTSTVGNLSFATKVDFTTGTQPVSVGIGDLDGDGKPDLAVANYNSSSNSLSILRNTSTLGALSFAAKVDFPTGTAPRYVGISDVDGDGKLDVTVANQSSNTASVFRNTSTSGTIALSAKVDFATQGGPSSATFGDIDGDGKPDLATANFGTTTASVLRNLSTSGTVSLATKIDLTAGSGPDLAAIGDIDGDGKPDLVVANLNGTTLSVLQQATLLTNITLSAGTLTPTFATGTLSYTATVSSNTSSLTVTPTASDPAASISVNGTAVTSGNASPAITLAFGSNTITVVLDGVTYTVIVTRPCAVTALAQNVNVTLNASGNATVTAAQVDNGSSSTCGAVTLSLSKTAFTCANIGANPVTLTVTDGTGASNTAPATVTVAAPALTSTTWSGTTSTAWTDCTNWSYGQVPTANISAVIPTGLTNYPSLPTGTYVTNGLTLASGASLTTASGAILQVNGDWTNNGGTATLAGSVQFVGTGAQTIGGSASTAFGPVVVNKASGSLTLGRDLAIGTSLTLTTGTLTTSSYKVAIGSSGTLSESETSYVTGNVEVTRNLNTAGTGSNFGGVGLSLTPASGSSTLPGSTLVRRVTGSPVTGVGTSTSIGRYFVITPTVDMGLNLTMVFGYFDHELNSIPEANLKLYKSDNGAAAPWQSQAGTTNDAAANTVTKTNISSLSTWTLGNSAAPLPVQLVSFTAAAQAHSVALAWRTASEVNSARFEVERSTDGVSFAAIGQMAAQGTKLTATDYALLDSQLPAGASTLYYRLRQVDQDGTAAYSLVRTVALAGATFQAYPVPAHAGQVLTVAGAVAGTHLEVLDALGRRVASATAGADGAAQLTLPTGLATGVYVLRGSTQTLRLTVE